MLSQMFFRPFSHPIKNLENLLLGVDKPNLFCYIKSVVNKQSKFSPHLMRTFVDIADVVANKVYHVRNKVRNYFVRAKKIFGKRRWCQAYIYFITRAVP